MTAGAILNHMDLQLTTTDTVFLIIIASLMSLFFLLLIGLVIMAIRLMQSVRRVAARAEEVVNSVEEVAETFVEAQGKLTVFKLIRNIMKVANRRRK